MGLIGFILLWVVANGVVSFLLAAIVRSTILAIFASIVITEMLLALYGLAKLANWPDGNDILLAVNITAMVSLPAIVGTSIGFVFWARRWQRKHTAKSKDVQT